MQEGLRKRGKKERENGDVKERLIDDSVLDGEGRGRHQDGRFFNRLPDPQCHCTEKAPEH